MALRRSPVRSRHAPPLHVPTIAVKSTPGSKRRVWGRSAFATRVLQQCRTEHARLRGHSGPDRRFSRRCRARAGPVIRNAGARPLLGRARANGTVVAETTMSHEEIRRFFTLF